MNTDTHNMSPKPNIVATNIDKKTTTIVNFLVSLFDKLLFSISWSFVS